MPCPIDDETVARIEKLLEDGLTVNEAAKLCRISRRTVATISAGKHRFHKAQAHAEYVGLVEAAADSLGLKLPADYQQRLIELRRWKRFGRAAEPVSLDIPVPHGSDWDTSEEDTSSPA